jgi:hypothetical protein
MTTRLSYLLIVFLTAMTLVASAQSIAGFVLFEDGQRVELDQSSPDSLEELVLKLLDSPKDGRCELSKEGALLMSLAKTGDQVVITDGGQKYTMTVTETRENFMLAKAEGLVIACKSNLKNIAIGLDIYMVNHNDTYPETLAPLVPEYLTTLPTCPTDGTTTYFYAPQAGSGTFELHCQGDHSKAGLKPGQPVYDNQASGIENADY